MKNKKGMSKNKRRTNTLVFQWFKNESGRSAFTKSFLKKDKKK